MQPTNSNEPDQPEAAHDESFSGISPNNPSLQNPAPQPQTIPPISPAPGEGMPPPSDHPVVPTKSKKSGFLIVLLVLIILGAGGAAAYLYTNKDTGTDKAAKVTPTPAADTEESAQEKYLVYADKATKTITVTNHDAEKIYTVDYTSSGQTFADMASVSPDGDILFELSSYGKTSSYLLVNNKGKEQTMSQAAVTALGSAKNATEGYSWPSIFLNSAKEAITTGCDTQSLCELSNLNLGDNTKKTILKATVPATTATGESLFAIKGFSSDRTQAYMSIAGPTTIDKSENALYKVNVASGKVTKLVDIERGNDFSVAPDGKKLVYVVPGNGAVKTAVHIVDLANGNKDTAVNWEGSQFMSGASSEWAWSSDSTKLALRANKGSYDGPLILAYLDTAKKSIVTVKTIDDPTKTTIQTYAWEHDDVLLYDYTTTDKPSDFTNPTTTETFMYNITTKKVTKLTTPKGYLSDIISY